MSDELKQLIEDAAKLLGLTPFKIEETGWALCYQNSEAHWFAPLDPSRGDLVKVAETAELCVDYWHCDVTSHLYSVDRTDFTKGDYPSLALAILRAASAVGKARNLDNLAQSSEELGGY